MTASKDYSSSHKARASGAIRRVAQRHGVSAPKRMKAVRVFEICLELNVVSGFPGSKKGLWDWFDSVKHQHTRQKKSGAKKRAKFYDSRDWRELRYQTLKAFDRRCMCCGAAPDDGRTVLHVDHIKPRSLFPELELDPDNLQILCADCNIGKSNTDMIDYRPNKQQEAEDALRDEAVLAYELRQRLQ